MKALLLLLFVSLAVSAVAQDTVLDFMVHKPKSEDTLAKMPQFPGGDMALIRFINRNVNYPEYAKENGIQGKVIVVFTVGPDGKLYDFYIQKGVSRDLDYEAVRVVRSLPAFTPGINKNGQAVPVRFILPISFHLG